MPTITETISQWMGLRRLFRMDKIVRPDDKRTADGSIGKGVPNDSFFGDAGSSWYNAQLQFPLDRHRSYEDLEELDTYGLASASLDYYAEESTQIDTQRGMTMWCESKNKQVVDMWKNLVRDLNFEDRIHAQARALAKYGDLFEILGLDETDGVVALKYVNPRHATRIEDVRGSIIGYGKGIVDPVLVQDKLPEDMLKPWEAVHWRVQSSRLDSAHGDSLLLATRRVWRQLKIMEDSIVLYRINRAPDRLMFFIDTGTQSFEEQMKTIQAWKMQVKKSSYLDPAQGALRSETKPYTVQEDYWFPVSQNSATKVEKMAGCFTGDTKIQMLDGTQVAIQDLVGRAEFWVYSFGSDGRMYPGRGHSARMTKKNAHIVRVTLDNGEVIRCTGDHRFMLKDGSYKSAEQLTPDDSLMPLYREFDRYRYEMLRSNSVEQDGTAAVYDISVDTHHNFSLSAGVVVHNSSNVGDVVDLEYFRNMFFATTKIPAAFMGFGGDLNSKATLTSQDVRFARTVRKLQRALLVGWTRLFNIHLVIKGVDPLAEGNAFKLQMTGPSYLDELQRMELHTMKAELATKMNDLGAGLELNKKAWAEYVLEKFLGLTHADVIKFTTQAFDAPTPVAPGAPATGEIPPPQAPEVKAEELQGKEPLTEEEKQLIDSVAKDSPTLLQAVATRANLIKEWERPLRIERGALPTKAEIQSTYSEAVRSLLDRAVREDSKREVENAKKEKGK